MYSRISTQHTSIAVSAHRYSISTKHSKDESKYTTHTHTHTHAHTHTHTNSGKHSEDETTTHHARRYIYTRINIHNIHKNIHAYTHTHTSIRLSTNKMLRSTEVALVASGGTLTN
jgi:hypothetical protein